MCALLFDFDGVLVKSMEIHYQAWCRALKEYKIEMDGPEDLYMLEGQGAKTVARQLAQRLGLSSEEILDIVDKKHAYYQETKSMVEIYPGLLDVLHWARDQGLKMAVVTGGNRARVTRTLAGFELLDFFSVLVTSDDVDETKPSPMPYLKAAKKLRMKPQQCVVIENAPLGIKSGKAAGMTVVAVTTTLKPCYMKEADIIVDDFKGLLALLKERVIFTNSSKEVRS